MDAHLYYDVSCAQKRIHLSKVSEKVIGSQALSVLADTIIKIDSIQT